MNKLNFSGAKRSALKRLARASRKVEKFCKSHPKKLSKRQHKTLRSLLKKRACALSRCTGTRIDSLFD